MTFQVALVHLPVRHRHPRPRDELAHMFRRLVIVSTRFRRPALPRQLFLNGDPRHLVAVLADVRTDLVSAARRGLDHADVPDAGEAHLQGTRDRRG